MAYNQIARVVDLTHPEKNIIYNMKNDAARERINSGRDEAVREIDGQFALVAVDGITVRLARSIGRPLRYFIAKLIDGPCLVVAERIDIIQNWLQEQGLEDQFHPSYTRMAPAHYVTRIELVGCPDPNPTYSRFFTPGESRFAADKQKLGEHYMQTLYGEIRKWLQQRARSGPIGVSFSAGVDSGSVFLLAHQALLDLGDSPSRLKAFTLSVEGGGEDVLQARDFLDSLDMTLFHETIDVPAAALDWRAAMEMTEDYKALDLEAATMNLALLQGIRQRYPEWRWLLDGDGGDENLKDYPIEENPELTIRSVLNNRLLYQEGWGVDAIKHSLTYSGGLSRGYMRTYAPADKLGFEGLSPYTLPNVIEVAEAMPFIEMTDWQHDKLYALKGEIVAAGVKAITGLEMPVFAKRRFQHGAASQEAFRNQFAASAQTYRRAFQKLYD